MHITELRLAGFKSFVDPVRAPIEPGLTGVVGPNGCGKSNLLEAVRWVMGATSAKSMRAADMDDVIFTGSAGRPSREHADVTLVLQGAEGRAPAPFNKEDVLEVTRRIRRGLGSTYRINGREVRAKDVQLLFADAATGANSPALVRQGQVSELIAAKPENRRRILEDAAGIAGLHARRHEADLKLKAAESNLTRLDEILLEIEAQAQSLKKQARQAERYRGLAQTLRETEALLLHRRWSEARARFAEAEAALRETERAAALAAEEASSAERAAEEAREALAPLREEEAIAAAVLRRLEGVRVGLERDLADAEAAIARTETGLRQVREEAERLYALKEDGEAALKRLDEEADAIGALDGKAAQAALKTAEDANARAASERAAAESKLEALASEAAAARARAQALTDAAQAARARLARLEQRKTELDAQLERLPASPDRGEAIDMASAAAQKARQAHAKARAALAALEIELLEAERADEANWSFYREAESALRALEAEVAGLAKLAPAQAVKFPPVLNEIEVAGGYERALAAALGDDLDASTMKDAPARWSGANTSQTKLPAGAEPLTQFVKTPSALSARLSLIGVVDPKDGPALAKQLPPGARLVSREGDLWRWDGFVRTAAAPQPAAARLEHKNRLAAARTELKDAAAKLAGAKTSWEQARAARTELETRLRASRTELPKLAMAEAEAVRHIEQLQGESERASERRADLEAQRTALLAEIEDARSTLASAEQALPSTGSGKRLPEPVEGKDAEEALAAARAEVEAKRAAAAEASAALAALTRERGARAARLAAIATERAQWDARLSDANQRINALAVAANEIEEERKSAMSAPERAREALATLMDQTQAGETRRARASDVVAQAESAARHAAEAARAKEEAYAAAREARAGAEAHARAAQARVEDIAAQAREQTGRAPEELAAAAGALLNSTLGQGALSEIERRFERLRAERDAAGPVNLRAVEELAEAQARIDGLTKEKDDVAQAIAKLRRAIGSLNTEARTRLLEAFEQVDRHFSHLFSALFEGGQAALKLTESEDPLESGLEIFAQPPGKRLTTLSLLSGGEQSLVATALIFAVFLSNPSPLCVLDEVDAPLDDANVDRFCQMLDEMKKLTATRFIVITHNPVTMSRMDRLYGVTMPEQGVSQLVSVDLSRAQQMAATA